MIARTLNLTVLISVLLIGPRASAQKSAAAANDTLVDRVGSTGFIQLEAESFRALTARQQELAYWLSQASIAIDPIIYDQMSRFGLRQKRILDAVVSHPQGVNPQALPKIVAFTKLFWANKGNHNEMTAQKFLPECSFPELKNAALQARRNGALQEFSETALAKELDDLKASLFDPDFEPMITAKSPKGGMDILQASANTFYSGVSLADLKNFHERYPLNSRLMKMPDGRLVEDVYRAGTSDGKIPSGLYAKYLKNTNT